MQHVVDGDGDPFVELRLRGRRGDSRAVGPVAHKGFAPGVSVYDIVNDTLGDLPDNDAAAERRADASVAALQFDLGNDRARGREAVDGHRVRAQR